MQAAGSEFHFEISQQSYTSGKDSYPGTLHLFIIINSEHWLSAGLFLFIYFSEVMCLFSAITEVNSPLKCCIAI